MMTEKELEKFLSQLREKVKPSEKLAQKIMADLPSHPKFGWKGLEIRERKKGRLSIYELIFNQIHYLMTKWKVIVPVAIVILAIVVWGVFQFGPKGPVTGPETGQPTGGESTEEYVEEYVEKEYVKTPLEIPVPQVTGDIDDTIDALTALSENELVIITEESNDVSLIEFDSQAIDDFGQSYDENEF